MSSCRKASASVLARGRALGRVPQQTDELRVIGVVAATYPLFRAPTHRAGQRLVRQGRVLDTSGRPGIAVRTRGQVYLTTIGMHGIDFATDVALGKEAGHSRTQEMASAGPRVRPRGGRA